LPERIPRDLGRVLLTSDVDLLRIAREWAAVSKPHAGVVYYHQLWTTLGAIVRDVSVRALALSADDARNRVFYVPRDRRA